MRGWSVRKVLVATIVANLLLGAALFGLRSPTRVASEEIGPRPELPAQMRDLNSRIQQGRHGEPFSLALSDAELTQMVGYFLGGRSDAPFARVRVAVAEQRLVLDGVTRGLAVTLPVRVAGTAGAREGKPWARVEDVSLGNTGVPGFIRDQILRQANAGLDLSRYDLAVSVESVEMRTGVLEVRGHIK